MTAVIEEVDLQCFKRNIKKRLNLSRGTFLALTFLWAVAQIDHTPMDVIVVDEEHRQPIQRPSLTVVIDVYSRVVLGFAIYVEKPSAFTAGIPKGSSLTWTSSA
jgi:putative transposase